LPLYTNLDGTTPDKNLSDILKWQIVDRVTGKRKRANVPFETPFVKNDGKELASMDPRLTWIGHATFVMRLGGKLIATDPIWSNRIHGAVPRLVQPGVAFEDVPPLDVVTVSHAHFDHLDMPSLKRIGNKTLFVVPKDNAEVLKSAGLTNVVELGWWESHTVDGLTVTLVPAQHWSMRMPWDRNKRLWGGFLYQSSEGVAYHAGDTAMSDVVFQQIHDKGPRIDWAMLPIGAYDPQWFMQPQHMGPEEAVRAYELLGAKHFFAMHWGTFKLTDEPLGEPPERLRSCWREKQLPEAQMTILDIGSSRALQHSTP